MTGDGKKRKARRPLHKNNKNKKAKVVDPDEFVPPARGPRRAVTAADLMWKPVDMPDMFNDADGFMGLEVIENVEIVREGKGVKFVTSDLIEPDGTEFEGFDDEKPADTEMDTAADADTDATKTTTDEKPVAKKNELKPKKEKKKPTEAKEAKPAETKKAKTAEKKKEEIKTGAAAEEDKAEPEAVAAKTDKAAEADKTAKPKETKVKEAKKKGKKAATEEEELSKGGGFSVLADEAEDVVEDGADVSEWVPLNLPPQLLSCLSKLKFTKPTTIQAQTIPEIMAGHDVIGKASTGSGKTLAFSIPIVQRWLSMNNSADAVKKEKKAPLALIMSPTRELAHQIATHIKNLCAALPTAPYVCSITGGLSTQKQQRQLELADIVVGTPGRLWEVLSSSSDLLKGFRAIQFLVIDEADRLLADGHFKEAEEILLALDHKETNEEYDDDEEDEEDDESKRKPRQTLVFSATFNKGLQQKLSGKGRYDLADASESMEHLLKRLNFREETPKFIDANPISQMARRLKEGLVQCGAMEKDLYLYGLLLLLPSKRTLVFTNSISSVRRLTPMLQNLDLPAIALHSEMIQKQRLRSVEQFTAAKHARGSVLIATDVAARGLDIPGIDAVVHYHVPHSADFYVHRSGRTARANRTGISVLLCAPKEVVPTRRLVAKIHANAAAKAGDSMVDNKSTAFFIRTLDIDRRIVGRLRERLDLAKKLADSTMAKGRARKDDEWLREMADSLGIDFEEAAERMAEGERQQGTGGDRSKQKAKGKKAEDEDVDPESEQPGMTKNEMRAVRFQLKQLLAKPINTGVSERYLAGGGINMNELLRKGPGDFLGKVPSLGFDDDEE